MFVSLKKHLLHIVLDPAENAYLNLSQEKRTLYVLDPTKCTLQLDQQRLTLLVSVGEERI